MGNDIFTKLTEQYPFITLCVYSSTEYVGIVQNQDAAITTIYDFGSIHDSVMKQKFLELDEYSLIMIIDNLFTEKYTQEIVDKNKGSL